MRAWNSIPGWSCVEAESPKTCDLHMGMSMPAPGMLQQGRKREGRWKSQYELWEHKDHAACLGFWAWMRFVVPGSAQSPLTQPPRIRIPYFSHLDLSPDPGITGTAEAENHFSFNLLGFFPPNHPRNHFGCSPLIPSHGWVGKPGAPLPWAGVSCCGTTPGGLGRSFPVLPPLQGVPLPWMRPVPVPRCLSHLTSVWFGVANTFQSGQRPQSGFFLACQVWLCRETLHKVVTFGSSCLAHLCLAPSPHPKDPHPPQHQTGPHWGEDTGSDPKVFPK